jgi:hypothetical protein
VTNQRAPVKCVDVECGYVHSVIVGLDGTLTCAVSSNSNRCVGSCIDKNTPVSHPLYWILARDRWRRIDGASDGKEDDNMMILTVGRPRQVADFNIWYPFQNTRSMSKKEKWKKFGKYEVKGRAKMMEES